MWRRAAAAGIVAVLGGLQNAGALHLHPDGLSQEQLLADERGFEAAHAVTFNDRPVVEGPFAPPPGSSYEADGSVAGVAPADPAVDGQAVIDAAAIGGYLESPPGGAYAADGTYAESVAGVAPGDRRLGYHSNQRGSGVDPQAAAPVADGGSAWIAEPQLRPAVPLRGSASPSVEATTHDDDEWDVAGVKVLPSESLEDTFGLEPQPNFPGRDPRRDTRRRSVAKRLPRAQPAASSVGQDRDGSMSGSFARGSTGAGPRVGGDPIEVHKQHQHIFKANEDPMIGMGPGPVRFPPFDMTCIRRAGISCDGGSSSMDAAADLLGAVAHSCGHLTEGPSYCVANECVCDRGFCADSKGHCTPQKNERVQGTYHISTSSHPKSYLAMDVAEDGTPSVVITGEGNSPKAYWVIIKRPDGTHLLTTVAKPDQVLIFVESCTGTDLAPSCEVRAQTSSIKRGTDVSTEIRQYGAMGQHKVLVSPTSHDILYFDLTLANVGLGCQVHAGDTCPGPEGYLLFDPPLPRSLDLKTQSTKTFQQIMVAFFGILAAAILIFFCWYECCLNVKSTRFL